jgi:hypothetical protein
MEGRAMRELRSITMIVIDFGVKPRQEEKWEGVTIGK